MSRGSNLGLTKSFFIFIFPHCFFIDPGVTITLIEYVCYSDYGEREIMETRLTAAYSALYIHRSQHVRKRSGLADIVLVGAFTPRGFKPGIYI